MTKIYFSQFFIIKAFLLNILPLYIYIYKGRKKYLDIWQ